MPLAGAGGVPAVVAARRVQVADTALAGPFVAADAGMFGAAVAGLRARTAHRALHSRLVRAGAVPLDVAASRVDVAHARLTSRVVALRACVLAAAVAARSGRRAGSIGGGRLAWTVVEAFVRRFRDAGGVPGPAAARVVDGTDAGLTCLIVASGASVCRAAIAARGGRRSWRHTARAGDRAIVRRLGGTDDVPWGETAHRIDVADAALAGRVVAAGSAMRGAAVTAGGRCRCLRPARGAGAADEQEREKREVRAAAGERMAGPRCLQVDHRASSSFRHVSPGVRRRAHALTIPRITTSSPAPRSLPRPRKRGLCRVRPAPSLSLSKRRLLSSSSPPRRRSVRYRATRRLVPSRWPRRRR